MRRLLIVPRTLRVPGESAALTLAIVTIARVTEARLLAASITSAMATISSKTKTLYKHQGLLSGGRLFLVKLFRLQKFYDIRNKIQIISKSKFQTHQGNNV